MTKTSLGGEGQMNCVKPAGHVLWAAARLALGPAPITIASNATIQRHTRIAGARRTDVPKIRFAMALVVAFMKMFSLVPGSMNNA